MFVQRYPPIYRSSLNMRRVLQCQSSTTVKWLWVVSLHANLWRWEMKIGSTSASKLIRLLLAQIQEGGLEVSTIRNLFLEINWSMIYIGYPCIINYFLCKSCIISDWYSTMVATNVRCTHTFNTRLVHEFMNGSINFIRKWVELVNFELDCVFKFGLFSCKMNSSLFTSY